MHGDTEAQRRLNARARRAFTGRIEARALRAFADARIGIMHFAHFFVGPVITESADLHLVVEWQPYPELLDGAGEMDMGAFLLAFDFALTAVLQIGSLPRRRIATAAMQVRFTGAPRVGAMRFEVWGERRNIDGIPTAMTRSWGRATANGRLVAEADNLYVRFEDPDPRPLLEGLVRARPEPALAPEQLDARELGILRRLRRLSRDASPGFAARMWEYSARPLDQGATGRWSLGPQALNRYDTAHGGLLCAFGALTAQTALPRGNRILEFSASLLGPGMGSSLRSRARKVQLGRRMATVDTAVAGPGGKPVLQMLSVHARF